MIEVLFKKLDPRAKIPTRAYESAGYDLFPLNSGIATRGDVTKIQLGFASAIEPGFVAVVDDRGSTGRRGLCHLAGVIDADFRGEWIVMMGNIGPYDFEYGPDKAIAQVLFLKCEEITGLIVDDLPGTVRGGKMLGSSDQ